MQRFEYDMHRPNTSRTSRGRSCAPRAERATILEKILTGSVVFLAIIIIIFIAYTVINYEIPVCQTKSCIETSALILDSIEKSAAPCDNFYNFACGSFMKVALEKNIPSRIHELKDMANRRYDYFYLMDHEDSPSSLIQRKYYQACMDEIAIELDGNKRFLNLLEQLDGWPLLEGKDYKYNFKHVEAMKTARHLGIEGEWFIVFDVFQKFEENETNILEIKIPMNADNITDDDEYVKMILDIRDIFIKNPPQNRSQSDIQECNEMVKFEKAFAKICSDAFNEDSDFPEYKIEDLNEKFRLSIDWLDLVNNMTRLNFTAEEHVMVATGTNYLNKLHMLLQQIPNRTQANYVIWKTIESTIPFLSRDVRERYEKYRRKVEGENYHDTDRFHFCSDEVSAKLEEAKLSEYLRKYMSKEKRKDISTLIDNIKNQYKKKIEETMWMSNETKNAALSRLNDMKYMIGGPVQMFEEESFRQELGLDSIDLQSNNLIDILREIYRKSADHLYSQLITNTNKERLKNCAAMKSVNPRMMLEDNTLFLPVGSLQSGYHDESRPQYLNYGSLGYIIAHEMTHALSEFYLEEQLGSNLDTSEGRVDCLMRSCHTVQASLTKWRTIDADKFDRGDCTRTVFEDFADHMGIEVSYKAYQQWAKKNGREKRLTGLKYNQNQLFWIINASLMCQKVPPGVDAVTVANHLSSPLRLLGYVRNIDSFKTDFHCPIGTNMNPLDKCTVS